MSIGGHDAEASINRAGPSGGVGGTRSYGRRGSEGWVMDAAAEGSRVRERAMSRASESGRVARKVRTIPPSARFEPSTPEPEDDPHPVASAVSRNGTIGSTSTQRRRPRPKLRYSTASESDAATDSDEEPPWWTFTQRGMMKMRARSMRRSKSDVEASVGGETGESGMEGARERGKGRKLGSRKTSRERIKDSTPSSSVKNGRSGSPPRPSGARTPVAMLRLNALRPSHKDLAPPIEIPRQRMQRSNSAPGSPSAESASPGLTTLATLVNPDEPPNPTEVLAEPQEMVPQSERSVDPAQSGLVPGPRKRAKRQMTAPAFPFLKRLSDTAETLTDSEAAMSASPRTRAKARLSPTQLMHPLDRAEESGTPTPDGAATPTRPQARRRQSHRLRINLPPPITQHFSNGWPHAGSWQDALYGYYEEEEKPRKRGTAESGNRNSTSGPSRKNSTEPGVASRKASNGEQIAPDASRPSTPVGGMQDPPASPPAPEINPPRRSRTRRKRYRQALVPPTPKGLGFKPSDSGGPHPEAWKEGRVGEHGFDWTTGHRDSGNGQIVGRIGEGDDLSRADTRATAAVTEKGDNLKLGRKLFDGVGEKRSRIVDEGWRKRWRRMLFLDARVTIWIRLVNLIVVIVLLGLAITIRLELIRLHLPGLIGASTTLIIAYASLTILHVLTAIYREYFGKPIGLWGLRSKMLWVCLDLLFVALWSSAMSLATNDYIATPLECTSMSAWWRSGLSDEYAELLADLQLLSDAGNSTALKMTATADTITPVDLISQTLGIVLPAEVIESSLAREACRRQAGCIALSLLALLLYGGNMVLSLFRVFETVRRTANVDRAVMV